MFMKRSITRLWLPAAGLIIPLAVSRPIAAQPTQAQYDSLVKRVADLEKSLSDLRNLAEGARGEVRGDLVLRGGRLCIVPVRMSRCDEDNAAQIQILGDQDASIAFASNLSGKQYQNPAAHWAVTSLSGDGGLRDLQNAKLTRSTYSATDPTNGVVFDSNLRKFIDPAREYSTYGTDSRGQWCMSQEKPGIAHEYTQDMCFRTYPSQKVIAIESWQSGWTFKFGTSTGFRTLDKWYTVPVEP